MMLARLVYVASAFVSKLFRWILLPFVFAFNGVYNALADRYPRVLEGALARKALVLTVAFVLFGGSVALIPQLGIELIPTMAQGEFDIELRLPPGTPLEKTDEIMRNTQTSAAGVPEIASMFGVSGTGNRLDANPDEGGENWGELHVALADDRAETEEEALRQLRLAFDAVPSAQYKFGRPALFSFDTPIEIEVAGYNLDFLKAVTDGIASRLRSSDRFADVKSSMEAGHPELQIYFDRERAAALGLAVHDIADRVVSHVRGDIATRYSWNDRKIDVLVRSREQDRSSAAHISQLIVNPESKRPVTLADVATVAIDIGPGEIRRVAQQRVGIVTANLQFGDLGSAGDEIDGILEATLLPTGVSVGLAGQSKEMNESFRSLLLALALAIFLVYLVMASQFESLIHPLVIFFSIPLALVGAVFALFITGTTISVVVFIGLILLAGIVVNNAIVLVDLINQHRASGMPKHEAIVEAGRLRLRPILMTTLTTALGLLPLAIGVGEGAEIRAPMAITVIGGLVVSTLLTLLVIPVMYSLLDRKQIHTQPIPTPQTD
jgi:HAE1 family hydrophobic/amphiphilic exporter-1